MKSAEGRGRTLDEAVDAALIELKESRRNVDIKVISEGSEETVVEVTVIDHTAGTTEAAPANGKAEIARGLVEGLLKHMGVRAQVTVRAATEPITLDISGRDLGALIGWRGETLRSLQTAVNLMLGEEGVETRRVILDVERYRARREDQVRELAQRLALRVKRSGEPYTLDPMHAYERRVIHMTLADDPDVTTESTGREPARRVVINPTGPAQGGPPERFEGARPGRPAGRSY